MKNRSNSLDHDLNSWMMFFTMTGFLIPIVIHDIRKKKIPDVYVLPGCAVLLLIRFFFLHDHSPVIILEGLCGYFFIWLLWFFTGGKIGRGDAKLSLFLAIGLGLWGWVFAIFWASFTGLLVAGGLIFFGKIKKEQGVPFAPFLAAGGIISFFTKDLIMRLCHVF